MTRKRKSDSHLPAIVAVLFITRLVYVLFNKIGSAFLAFSEDSLIQSPITQGILQFFVGVIALLVALLILNFIINAFLPEHQKTPLKEQNPPQKGNNESSKKAFIQTENFSTHTTETNVEKDSSQRQEVQHPKVKKVFSIATLKEIEWYSFEQFCKKIYEICGYWVTKTPAGADEGIDLILHKGSYEPNALVQCKVRTNQSIGVNYIRELRGVMAAKNVAKGILFCNTSFTRDAIEFAAQNSVELIDLEVLYTKLRQLKVEDQEILYDYLHSMDYKTPTCPNCETKLVVRETKKGDNKGQQFWGCNNFPKCRYKMPMNGSRWNN